MKKFECFIFYVSLSIIFLSFSSSFAHEPPAQDTPQPQAPPSCPPCPPCPCPCPCQENQQTPPTQGNQQTPPPTQENQQTPPTQENQGTPPPTQENQGTPPPTQENQGTPPPTQENQGTAPPTQENQGTSPPTQENQGTSPPTQENQGTSPPTQENQGTSPPTQENQGTSPPTQENQGTSPPTQENQGTSPPTQENQGTSPPTQENQGTSPPTQENQGTPPSTGQTSETSISGENNVSFKGSFSKIYAFGDSFTDTGNCVFMEGFKSFIDKLFSSSPYASSVKLPGHRLSNGRLVIDFLCDDLGLPSLQAYKDAKADFSAGANFAVAGSTCLASDFFAKQKNLPNLLWKSTPENTLTQIDWFSNYITSVACKDKDEAQCKSQIESSLFWIGALGFSDYARIFESAVPGKSLAETSVDHVSTFLKTLLEKGAKFIVVQGLPPAGCCPLQMLLNKAKQVDSMGCSSVVNTMIMAHNELLQKKVEEFRAQSKGSVIVYADTWKAYQAILTNYKKYGFEEPMKACCGAGGGPFNFNMNSLCGAPGTLSCQSPQKYISWDGIHFTEAMNKHLAELFFKQKGYCSPSFDVLIQAKISLKVV